MLDLKKDSYIILELIPSAYTKEKGDIVQLSALKLDGLQLVDRFDYRLQEDLVTIPDLLKIIQYDKKAFHYLKSTDAILKKFQKWSLGLPLLIMDNGYTENFLAELSNSKESIFSYLGLSFHDGIITEIMEKYHLEPSDYIVDLLYEAVLHSID